MFARGEHSGTFTISPLLAVTFYQQVFWLSDRLRINGLPLDYLPKVTGRLALKADPHPRLQRRDRHGFAPCSGMLKKFAI